MSLRTIATETLSILENGTYRAPSGRSVSIAEQVIAAIRGTVLVRPDESILRGAETHEGAVTFEVTEESTAQAARRLVTDLELADVALLNFASAKNPGGGFVGGARAQEEDLARASALYPCLRTQRAYYDVHRATPSLLYTDHVIHSPAVPFFRDDRLVLLEVPFLVSVLTASAPNAGEVLRRDANATRAISEALERRTRRVLEVAASRGHRALVLGAWGCGVFRNHPRSVAGAFGRWLGDPQFAGVFERVVFAIHDRSARKENLSAFRDRFS